MNWRENTRLVLAATSALSVATGAAAGYVAATRILEKKFQERLDAEILDAKAYFQDMYSTPVFEADDKEDEGSSTTIINRVVPADATDGRQIVVDPVGEALSAMSKYDPEGLAEKEEEDARHTPVIVNNIFTNLTPPGEEVLGALMADRDPSVPYIITKEEYYKNEPDFDQFPFTYWEGDGVLIDDREEYDPINDIDYVAGEENLLRFGYGSGDEHLIYIRNEKSKMDICVTRSTGKYADEVMDMNPEEPHLEHSVRRFRSYDD